MMRIRSKLRRWLNPKYLPYLKYAVIELNDIEELKKVFGWRENPTLDDPSLDDFEYVEDVNQRRRRDAECIATVVRNAHPAVCLEIGTSTGHSTALMALNAPQSHIHTVNIPPEEIHEGGTFTTFALEREKIGSYYRERGLNNITQILANTARWEPDIGLINVAFIDGCHDSAFVYNDTRKVLRACGSGSFILWHDFNPSLAHNYDSISAVLQGVERLFAERLLQGRIFHVRDSWIGVCRVD